MYVRKSKFKGLPHLKTEKIMQLSYKNSMALLGKKLS